MVGSFAYTKMYYFYFVKKLTSFGEMLLMFFSYFFRAIHFEISRHFSKLGRRLSSSHPEGDAAECSALLLLAPVQRLHRHPLQLVDRDPVHGLPRVLLLLENRWRWFSYFLPLGAQRGSERECALGPFWQKKWQVQQAKLFHKMACICFYFYTSNLVCCH